MSMKTFTLSSVCVLVYCMLLAVSGTTDLLEKKDNFLEQLSLGTYQESQQDDSKPLQVAFATGKMSAGLQDWTGGVSKPKVKPVPKEANYHLQIRVVGLLFLAAWIFISFKLLFGK